jgi:hypothetical protein
MDTKVLQVTRLTFEQMLAREEDKAYNPAIWDKRVKDYMQHAKAQFYVIEAGSVYKYPRFYVSYIYEKENIHFFKKFDAFSSSLTNNGFCCIEVDEDGNVCKRLFRGPGGKEGYAVNNRTNRKMFSRLTELGIMVSNDM